MYRTGQTTLDFKARIEAIRKLKLRNALEVYGVEFGHNGFARCPFHREKTGSFKLHNNKYKCFGCGASGDLIDFVMQRDGVGISAAVNTICADFGIEARPTPGDLLRMDQMRMERTRSKREYADCFCREMEMHDLYLRAAELRDRAAALPGGKNPENEIYADAQFALMQAAELLRDAEYAAIDYGAAHPEALPIPPKNRAFPEKLEWVREDARRPFFYYMAETAEEKAR